MFSQPLTKLFPLNYFSTSFASNFPFKFPKIMALPQCLISSIQFMLLKESSLTNHKLCDQNKVINAFKHNDLSPRRAYHGPHFPHVKIKCILLFVDCATSKANCH